MSMEKALAALNKSAPEVTQGTASEIVNMGNTGANIDQTAPQGTQETKEKADNAPQIESAKIEEGVVEAAPITQEETTKKEEVPNKVESTKFAALAKKEKALVKLQNDIKSKEAAIAEKEAAIAAREAAIKESESLWETDVLKALESKGYTYQKLTDMILSGKVVPDKAPEDPIEFAKKIEEKLRKEFAEKEAAREAAAKKQEEESKKKQEQELEAAYQSYREEVNQFTKEFEAEYELINMYEQQELVIDTVKQYYDQHKRVLSTKEASDMVEKYLYDEAQKALQSKKFAKKASPVEKAKTETTPTKTVLSPKTLSNNLTPTMSSVLPAATDAERMKRALDKLNSSNR